MSCQKALRFFLLATTYAWPFSSPVCAQLPQEREGCAVNSSLANEIRKKKNSSPQQKIIIDSVEFEGAILLPLSIRDELFTSLKQRAFDGNSKWLQEVELAAIGTWQDHGFFQAMVNVTPRPVGGDATTQRVALTVHVNEGQQYRLSEIVIRPADIAFTEATAFPREELRKLVPLEDGEIFSTAKIRQGLDALRNFYASKGYIDFTAIPLTDIDAEGRLIGLILELDEQKQFRFARIETSGLDSKLEEVLKERLRPGDIFNHKLVKDFFEEFKGVLPAGASIANVDIRRNPEKGTVDFLLDLRPCPPPAL
jgi:outer membrane protein assembly factor BamA